LKFCNGAWVNKLELLGYQAEKKCDNILAVLNVTDRQTNGVSE